MKTPHKHAELIKAWADGAKIEFFDEVCRAWLPAPKNPAWDEDTLYRIKPKPDFQQTMDVYMNKMYKHYPEDIRNRRLMIGNFSLLGTMNLTFDGTTGQLKSAEVL
jgi:hypothetical protein